MLRMSDVDPLVVGVGADSGVAATGAATGADSGVAATGAGAGVAGAGAL